MADPGKKPNNDLYDLNDLLAGVEASEESVDDILAEIYGRPVSPSKPPDPEPESVPEAPPVRRPEQRDPDRPRPIPRPVRQEPDPEQIPAAVPESRPAARPEQTPEELFYRTEESAPPKAPPVYRDQIGSQPEQKSPSPPKKRKRGKILSFPRGRVISQEPEPPREPDNPSAWVEPDSSELPAALLDAVFADYDAARPDGPVPGMGKKGRPAKSDRQEQYQAKAPEAEDAPQPGQGKLSQLRSRADAFADSMFSQAGGADEETEIAEKYIPGTDEETVSPAERRTKRRREPRVRREKFIEEGYSPQGMAHIYFSGLNFMSRRTFLLFLLSLVSCYLTLADVSFLPIPALLAGSSTALAEVQLLLLGWALVFGLDVLWMGFASLLDGMFTLHTLGSFAILLNLLDGLIYCTVGRSGPMPYTAPATLLLFCLTWGAYDRKLGNYRACRQAAFSQTPWRVTKDPFLWNGRDTFTRVPGDPEGFTEQIQGSSGTDLMQSRLAPLIALASLLFSLLATVVRGNPGLFLWSLATMTLASSPLSALLCYAQPWLRLTRRLEHSGAAAAGWPGVRAAGGDGGVLVGDTDLFPEGTIQFNGIKVYGDIPLEKLAGCTASLIRASGSGLTDLFDGLVRTQGGFYRNVDNFRCHEGGGLSGSIRGELILVGTANFMRVMNVPLPQDLKVNQAVFCAIDGALRGIFALNYDRTPAAKPAVTSLLQAGLVPVLVPRDFNLTPSVVRQKLKIPVERLEYPPVERRLELTAPDQEHAQVLTALLSRDGIASYAEAIVGCRRLRSTARRSGVLTLISSAVGLFLGYYLTAVQAFASLSPVNMLLFLVLWIIPTLLFSGSVNRY